MKTENKNTHEEDKALPVTSGAKCNEKAILKFKKDLNCGSDDKKELILDYPTVYILYWQSGKQYEVYVGETSNIIRRTMEHLNPSEDKKRAWHEKLKTKSSKMFVVGHKHFNKSLTLDIENKLRLYMLSVENVKKVHNCRGNAQSKYYTSDEFDSIFNDVWKQLQKSNPKLFPMERVITDSALFKASPFRTLTLEQYETKRKIISKIKEALKNGKRGQVIFVAGEAGTGKTVLNSSLFYDLCSNEEDSELKDINCFLVVNHDEQLKVYKQIAGKLDLNKEDNEVVGKSTSFIKSHFTNAPLDVVMVDEAHLLWTQGNQAYSGKNQLMDIIDRARVVVVMFDKKQILRTDQYWEHEMIEEIENQAKAAGNYLKLKNQLRIKADPETIEWIRDFIDKSEINKIPVDKRNYEINIFDTPFELEKEIRDKAKNVNEGLSRLVATFDWEYIDKKKPWLEKYWEVKIGDWNMPWNKQIKLDKKAGISELSWAEQEHTINEVGSTYTIQGFDLNYVGVILGPSVKYRNGKVIFDASCSKNKKAVQNRTLSDGSKQKFGEILLRNEINVLLTRGVKGLYIYAQDDELRGALKNAKKL